MNTTGPSRGPSRGRVALIAAAAAVVVLAGVGIAFSVGGDDEPARTTAGQKAESPSPSGSSDGATESSEGPTVTYTLDGSNAPARCVPPNPEGIRELDAAFAGTAVAVSADQVVIEPTQFYRGEKASRVQITLGKQKPSAELLPVDFQEGKDYLVAIADGHVQLCGYTTPMRGDLAQSYAKVLGKG